MRNFFLLVFLCVSLGVSLYFLVRPVYSDELDDINKKISDLQSALDSSRKATKPLETELMSLVGQLNGIQARVSTIEQDLIQKRKNIDEGYKNLAKQQM